MNEGLVTRALWNAEDAAAATQGRLVGPDSWIATGLSIDTRTLEKGDLFVALSDARDGHDFAPQAFEKGAAAALVSNPECADGPLLVVGDVLEGLRKLAEAARTRSPARRVAITGSVGKTSVKEAVAACLKPSGLTHHAEKSFNNHIGVPLTLARMPAETAFGVFEIGMNHRGEIAPLAEIVRPHIAIVTTIAPVHLEALGDLETIAEEKGDLYGGLTRDGVALVPADAPCADRLFERAKQHAAAVVRFGASPGCDARLISLVAEAEGSTAEADILGKPVKFRIGAPGAHWGLNAVAALASAALAGADFEAALAAIAALRAAPGRGAAQRVRAAFGEFTLVDDAYNASTASIAAALDTLAMRAPGPGGRRIAALGDMLELGPQSAELHASLAAPIDKSGVDLVFCAGPLMQNLWDQLPASRRGGYAESADSLLPLIAGALQAGDVVLVKGSNGSKMSRVVSGLAALSTP